MLKPIRPVGRCCRFQLVSWSFVLCRKELFSNETFTAQLVASSLKSINQQAIRSGQGGGTQNATGPIQLLGTIQQRPRIQQPTTAQINATKQYAPRGLVQPQQRNFVNNSTLRLTSPIAGESIVFKSFKTAAKQSIDEIQNMKKTNFA
jgi:hypothetical protein